MISGYWRAQGAVKGTITSPFQTKKTTRTAKKILCVCELHLSIDSYIYFCIQ